MKKIAPVLALVLLAIAGWYFTATPSKPSTVSAGASPAGSQPGANGVAGGASTSGVTGGGSLEGGEDENDEEGFSDEDLKPAAQRYRSAEEALAAVKAASASYDDLVLEQFTTPGDDCTWCPQFYQGVKELLLSPETNPEQRSYYAELMAASGRVDNISTLIDGIKNAPNQEDRDIMTEALELTMGKDDVVKYLGDQLSTDNPAIKESVIAAITNQGSPLAAEILYKQAMEAGDPDGFYSQGIGLGELVPDESAIPFLQDAVIKRDAYSHLAVKALLNSGVNGLRVVFDVLANSKDADFDRKMLKDAADHVSFDSDSEAYVQKIADTASEPARAEFAKQILADFKAQEDALADPIESDEDDEEEEPMQSTP